MGKSLSGFMRLLGVYSSSGEKHTRLRNQMKRLFGCTVSMIYENGRGEARVSSLVAGRTVFWWNERKSDECSVSACKGTLDFVLKHEVREALVWQSRSEKEDVSCLGMRFC